MKNKNLQIQIVAMQTILTKETKRMFRVWSQTFLPSVITTALYFLIFGKFIGSQIQSVGGVSYMEFIVPGLVMMAVITNAFANVVASFYGAKFQKNLEEVLVAPVSYTTMIFGYVFGGVMRGFIVGALTLATALFFTHLSVAHILWVIFFAIMSSLLFSLAGLINGIYAKSFDQTSIITTFALTPLTYLGGVFYSIHLLPQVWQNISYFNPVLYIVNGFRYGFIGTSDINIWYSVAVVTSLTIAFFIWAIYLFSSGRAIKM
jgi:ABC-2 type transport system permease protein